MKTYTKLEYAQRVATGAYKMLEPAFHELHVAGSVRREQWQVADIELVGIPKSINDFKTRTHNMVQNGRCQPHDYTPSRPEITHRWGDKYRGFDYAGMLVEVFTATPHTFGYIYWLRTGPGKANTAVMTLLARKFSPVRFADGSAWHVAYTGNDPSRFNKLSELSVPDELTLFRLLNIPYVDPESRGEAYYDWHMNNADWSPPSRDVIEACYFADSQPVQKSLF